MAQENTKMRQTTRNQDVNKAAEQSRPNNMSLFGRRTVECHTHAVARELRVLLSDIFSDTNRTVSFISAPSHVPRFPEARVAVPRLSE